MPPEKNSVKANTNRKLTDLECQIQIEHRRLELLQVQLQVKKIQKEFDLLEDKKDVL